jgi:hypothetical protein
MSSIREFTQQVLEMQDKKQLYEPIDWNHVLKVQGYMGVSVPIKVSKMNEGERTQMRTWCNLNVGEEHYVWTGSQFWFETESAAVLFALRWS